MAAKQVLEPLVKCLNCGIKINYKTDCVKKRRVRYNLVNVRKKEREGERESGRKNRERKTKQEQKRSSVYK